VTVCVFALELSVGMPWKAHSLLEARQHFVQAALRGPRSVAELCREAGISRKTGFKWLNRFRHLGGPGLCELSRRPRHSPKRTAQHWLSAIVQLRRQHPHWGGKKIFAKLRRQHPRARLPKVRTITKWLQQLKLVRRRRTWARRGPLLPRPALTTAQAPNEVWTVDFKGWFRTRDGQKVNPLTVRDLFSRYLLGIELLPISHEPVCRYFQRLFARAGQPKIIRVDHGSPFAGDGALDLSRLSAWWLRLGIQVEFTARAQPQDNAAHEQMHRVYKAELASPPAATPRAQQWRSTRWVTYYNEQRPHEALDQLVPAALYKKSRRKYRGPLPALTYPRGVCSRLVTRRGYIRWRGRLRSIGRAFGSQYVGIKPITEGVHEVYFGRQLIGLLVDTDLGGLRPAKWLKAPITSQA
jgi:transposase InsO family protein